MRRFVLSMALALIAITGVAQQHGSGTPASQTPPANCAANRFYVDDSTQQLWFASVGSPCYWAINQSLVALQGLTTYSSTASLAPATVYTTQAAGFYQVCSWVVMTVAATAGSYTPVAGFTASGHAFSGLQIGASLTATSQWTHNGNSGSMPPICPIFWADANTAITYGINASSVTGTPTLAYTWTIQRLQ